MLRAAPSRLPLFLLLASLGLLAGLALAAALALPRLATFSPAADAQNVSSRAPLRLTFNRPMDTASVERALRLDPAQAGAWSETTWDAAQTTLIFTPAETWPLEGVVTVTLAGGRSRTGLPLLGEQRWTFTVSGKRIAYLLGTPPNLWLSPLAEGGAPQQVTNEPIGVYDFDIRPDGGQFVYAALRADGGADLRAVNPDGTGAADLLLCPGVACLAPVFSPDGARIAYERRSLLTDSTTGGVTFGDSRVHLYTPATGVDEALSEEDTKTQFPRWGPDGRVSYFDSLRQAMVIHDLATGALTYIPDASGEMGTWSPDGQFIVYPEVYIPAGLTEVPGGEHSDRFFGQLLKVAIATNATEGLSGAELADDASPAYSPSGEWIAFGRRGLAPDQWTPGRQLWLMRADGSEARPLTTEPLYNHSAFEWSLDGAELVYMRVNTTAPPAEIWAIKADGTGARRLIEAGYLPEWVP